MAYDVSSSFIHLSRSKSPVFDRVFTIAGSDYSHLISKWPKFKKGWDDIRPKSLQLKLANNDKSMNFLRDDKTKMIGECVISMGINGENIDLFTGNMKGVKYSKENCTLTIVDKFQDLSDRQLGTSDNPVDYTTSSYLPSDIAWYAVTSYGGYSADITSNNPDIDMESFDNWAAIFSGDSVLVQGRFDGQKVTEVLRKIARHTHSAIFIKEDKLSFHRFGIADANVSSLGPSDIINMDLDFNTGDITNRQYVSGDYDVNSDFHQFTVKDDNSTSINSFGLKENTLKDNTFWYVDSGSAINLAQRKIISNAEPDDSITVLTGLVGLPRIIGETLTVLDDFHGITESYRILEHEIDMDRGRTKFKIDRTQLTNAFTLDVTSLGSTTEVLT